MPSTLDQLQVEVRRCCIILISEVRCKPFPTKCRTRIVCVTLWGARDLGLVWIVHILIVLLIYVISCFWVQCNTTFSGGIALIQHFCFIPAFNTGEVEHVPTWEKFDHSHMVITSKWWTTSSLPHGKWLPCGNGQIFPSWSHVGMCSISPVWIAKWLQI